MKIERKCETESMRELTKRNKVCRQLYVCFTYNMSFMPKKQEGHQTLVFAMLNLSFFWRTDDSSNLERQLVFVSPGNVGLSVISSMYYPINEYSITLQYRIEEIP